ncbi:hypothetical protein J1614_002993 [Plenodomus biglobosus]|nr:hypothetical protein J1614_002993 [Plenodomus biglobosus]
MMDSCRNSYPVRSGDDAVIPDRAAGCAQITAHPSYIERRVEANTDGEEADVEPHNGHDHFPAALKRSERLRTNESVYK